MRLLVDDPVLVPALVAALRAGDCLADRVGPNAVDVLFPRIATPLDVAQALTELRFFARAWELTHPGVGVRLASPG